MLIERCCYSILTHSRACVYVLYIFGYAFFVEQFFRTEKIIVRFNFVRIIAVRNLIWFEKYPEYGSRPIGYIMLLSLISLLKHGVWRLWGLIYGLLTMGMLVGSFMANKDPGKVRNRRVAKSRIVLFILTIIIILVK